MKALLLQFFTWWNGQTMGTRFWIWRKGVYVGKDEFGNIYYRSSYKKDKALGHERRWVVYNGEAEASRIPPGWWGWMHHNTDTPPTETEYQPRPWQLPYIPNMTGTAAAYRPPGSAVNGGGRERASGDYDAWQPGN